MDRTAPVASSAPAGIFRNVAQEAGLNFRLGHGGKTPLNILETLGHGCAFLDYDNVGGLDILLVGNRRCALYRNRGNGHFRDVTAESGLTAEGAFFGVAVGDYDNDGYPDVYLTGYGKSVLYHNRGAGPHPPAPSPKLGRGGESKQGRSLPLFLGGGPGRGAVTPIFEDVTKQAGVGTRGPYDVASAAAFVDLDGDGRLDLFVGRYIKFTPDSPQLCDYHGVKASCGVKDYSADFPSVYRNNGNGTFTDVTKAWGFDKAHGKTLGVTVRAMESGKGVALYVANDEQPGDLFVPQGGKYVNIGTSSGTAFNHNGLTQAGMGSDWGDFNNDLRPDLIVATFQTEPKPLYRNDGQETYTEISGPLGLATGTLPYIAWTARFFDYDNDGWLDILFTNGHTQDNVAQVQPDRTYRQPLLLYHNEQGNLFRDVSAEAGPAFAQPIVGRGAAFGDYDNDGKMDALVIDEEGAPLLLHNEDKSGNHWLQIILAGTRCNRDAIGARVLVTAGGKTTLRDQQLCGGYLSAHDPRPLFGLGKATKIEKIVVRWPDGNVTTVTDVPFVDTRLVITQQRRR